MKALTIRKIPDQVYLNLQIWAKKNHRSLQEQAKIILEREVQLIKGGQVFRAREWRRALEDREWGDIVEDVRKERKR